MINWRYIKGMSQAGAGTDVDQSAARAGRSEVMYTFLYFKRNAGADFKDFEFSPGISVNDGNSFDVGANHDKGRIITEKSTNQHINTPFTFLNELEVTINNENIFKCYSTGAVFKKPIIAEQVLVFSYSGTSTHDFRIQNTSGTDRDLDFTAPSENSRFRFNYNGVNWLNLDKYGIAINGKVTASGDIEAGGKCQALYFNATSDRRAKDNLKILNFKALDLINHTNLYSFTYKDTNTPSIGIIAQDVQNINIDGFKLVDNENATGQDMDYMSIHESKLVYILWQAIKEQQKEIEELKKRLK